MCVTRAMSAVNIGHELPTKCSWRQDEPKATIGCTWSTFCFIFRFYYQFVELSLYFGKRKSVCLSACLSARRIFSNTFQWPRYKLVTDDIRTTYSILTDHIYWSIPHHQANLAKKYIHDIVPWNHTANVSYGTLCFRRPIPSSHTIPHTVVFPYSHITYHQHIPHPIPGLFHIVYIKPCSTIIPCTNIL